MQNSSVLIQNSPQIRVFKLSLDAVVIRPFKIELVTNVCEKQAISQKRINILGNEIIGNSIMGTC